MRKLLITLITLITLCTPSISQAQTVEGFESEYVRVDILERELLEDFDDIWVYTAQTKEGELIEFQTVEGHVQINDSVYLEHFVEADQYVFVAVYRGEVLGVLIALFIVFVLLFTQKKGVRALLSLSASFLLLIFGLIPLLLDGYDPILVSLGFGTMILFLSIFVTHGFSRQSAISFIGSGISIIIAAILVSLLTSWGSFSGVTDHSALFLSQYANADINFLKLFSAAVIIGTLGVLDDITITQVSVVRELAQSSKEKRTVLFNRAIRVGKDHITSLVNTLVFAYVGSALPLLMFASLVDTPFMILISQEFIAAEVIRTFVGAIALIIAVPITTWCACYPFFNYLKKDTSQTVHHCHHH